MKDEFGARAFRAYSRNHGGVVANTPRAAATKFFAERPDARKCDVIEGRIESDETFVVLLSRVRVLFSAEGITRKTINTLPEEG